MSTLGIDAGMKGAIVVLRDDGSMLVHDIMGSRVGAIGFLREHHHEVNGAVIEKAQTFGQEGRVSLVTFIGCREALWGALVMAQVPILKEPAPQEWKAAVGITCHPPARCPKDATDTQKKARRQAMNGYRHKQKQAARDRASVLYPQSAKLFARVQDSDRAEAVLMAHYGLMLMRGTK